MRLTTEYVTLSLTRDTANMLRAFTEARNGSIHNQADSALRHGIVKLVSEAPASFRENYRRALQDGGKADG